MRRLGRTAAGVTLIEMLVVVAIIAVMAAVAMPSLTAGLDTLRLNGAAGDVVTFLNGALNRAERQQRLMELTVRKPESRLILQTTAPGIVDELNLPDGVKIAAIYPALPNLEDPPARQFLLLPGGTVPQIAIELINARGMRRLVRVDPITGVPMIEKLVVTEAQGPLHSAVEVTR